MSFYLDASVLVPLFISESESEIVSEWIAAADGAIHVSDLAAAEFSASLSRLVRMSKLSDTRAMDLHDQFDLWRSEAAEALENLPVDVRAAGRLVRSPFPKLLAPDALHLATCRRLGLTLVTHDKVLSEIARREDVVAISPT